MPDRREYESMFSPHVREVFTEAKIIAKKFLESEIQTEHVLGALLARKSFALLRLTDFGIDWKLLEDRLNGLMDKKDGGDGPNDGCHNFQDDKVLSNPVLTVVKIAGELTTEASHSRIDCEHVVYGLLVEADGEAGKILRELGVTGEKYRDAWLKEQD